jgi:hypothetical protein
VDYRRVMRVLAFGAAVLSACARAGDTPLPDAASGSSHPASNPDAGTHGQDSGAPSGSSTLFNPFFDGGFVPVAVVQVPECSLAVGAECDGNEDCGHKQVCCGHFDQLTFSYTSIGCESTCAGADDFQLCHSDDVCAAGTVCRPSLILPYDFIRVCATPIQGQGPSTDRDVADEVACGARNCKGGQEQCCLTAHFDRSAPYPTPVAEEPYCAPRGDDCVCHHQSSDANSGPAGDGDDGGI